MSKGKLKYFVGAALFAAASATMASTLPAFDGTLNVTIGGPAQNFGGSILEGETADNWLVNVGPSGSHGLTTAASVTFSSGTTSMSLYNWTGEVLGSLIGTVSAAVQPGSLTLAAVLDAGSYVLQIAGPEGTGYGGAVSAVPLPGAALLFGSALLGAGALRRKKSAAAHAEPVPA